MAAKDKSLVGTVEEATGLTKEQICDVPLDEQREIIERRMGHRLQFCTHFPFLGRGSVLLDRLKSHDDVERALKKALR